MRRIHISTTILALVAAACTSTAAPDTTLPTPTSLIVTTTSTLPPSTLAVPVETTTDSLEVWVPDDAVRPVGAAADAFEIDSGIRVEVKALGYEAMLAVILADPNAGPDVFIGPHAWLGQLTRAGIAEPLAVRSEVVAGAAAAVILRGIAYGVPLALDTIVQFRDPVARAVAPAAVEDLASGCGPDSDPCLILPAGSGDVLYPFLTALGGYLFAPDEFDGWDEDDIGVADSGAVAGGLILQSVIDGAGILIGDDETPPVDRFVEGDAPLIWGDAATLAALGVAGVVYLTEPIPTIGSEPAPTPIRVTAAWVNAFSPDKEAAVAFAEDYLAAPGNADPIAVAMGLAPATIGYDEDPDLVAFIQAARRGHPVPTITATDLAWIELGAAFDAIRDGEDATAALIAAAANIRAGG